mmetsp:Transcript_87204/g.154454  ORF Transcript_87204/g.154454 Transcript_87204/m.154454 type:complete len:395 (+) Transcript_87204:54-1238(+)
MAADEDAAHAAFWAEFQRRRREDRQRNQREKSEVQQILQDIRKERSVLGTLSTAVTPAGHSQVSGSLAASRAEQKTVRRALSFTPSPRRGQEMTEVQQILADVQKERLAGVTSAASPSKPKQRPAKPVVAVDVKQILPQKAPVPKSPKSNQPTDSTHRRSRSSSRSRLNTSSSSQKPEDPAVSSPRATSPSETRRRSLSSTPSRRHQLPTEAFGFVHPQTATWGASLRRASSASRRASSVVRGTASRDASFDLGAKMKPLAYPAGGWDDRTACPRTFDLFPGGAIKREAGDSWYSVQGDESQQPCNRRPWDSSIACPKSFSKMSSSCSSPRAHRASSKENKENLSAMEAMATAKAALTAAKASLEATEEKAEDTKGGSKVPLVPIADLIQDETF